MKYVQHSSRILLLFSILTITFVATQEVVLEDQFLTLDKFLHFGCFIYLTIIAFLSKIFYQELWVYVIVLGYGILIEIVQIYIPYRSFEFFDIFADFAGILIASFFIKFSKIYI